MRWKLISSHYLKVQGVVWEQIEVDPMTGKQVRKRYDVPMQLDIEDPTLWNDDIIRNPRGEILGGSIVVAHATGEHKATDYIFTGNPTPDMFPLDSEAEALSAKFEEYWNAKPNEEISYERRLIEEFGRQRAEMEAKSSTVKVEGLSEILQSMNQMMKQNAELIATLISAKPADERRV